MASSTNHIVEDDIQSNVSICYMENMRNDLEDIAKCLLLFKGIYKSWPFGCAIWPALSRLQVFVCFAV